VASLAAIMSTADSLIIAISQLVTVEIIYPLRSKASPNAVAWYGRSVSLFSVGIALLIGIYWDEGISDLGKIQFPLSTQAIPAFLFGLYSINEKTDVHPWCIATGALSAVVYTFSIYFGYLKIDDSPKPINAGITGLCLQLVVILMFEALRRIIGITGKPEWDVPLMSRFGDKPLTAQLLWKSMEGVNEPLSNPWWCFLMFYTISMCTPLTPEMEPPLDVSGSENGNVFLYSPAVYNGLPWWAFKVILMNIVPTVLLLVAIYKMPGEFAIDDIKLKKEGIDPNLVEMTHEELGHRSSYDETNTLIQLRRSSISQTMDELNFTAKNEEMMNSLTANDSSQRKLLDLVRMSIDKGSMISVTEENEEEAPEFE